MSDPSAKKPMTIRRVRRKGSTEATLAGNATESRGVKKEKATRVQAGRTAVDTNARVDELCSAVEAPQDPERHRERLKRAMLESGAIGVLGSVRPIENPSSWLAGMFSGYGVDALVTRARALRSDEDRCADFLNVLARSLADSGTGPPRRRRSGRVDAGGLGRFGFEGAECLVGDEEREEFLAGELSRAYSVPAQ